MTLVLIALACLPLAATAEQISTGVLAGVITDASGRVVAAASIRIVHVATGIERRVTAGDDGAYGQAALPSGEYRVFASAPGFAATERLAHVEVGNATRVD